MAGEAKPDIEGLGKEAQYKVISFVGTGGGTVDNFGLFDGTTPDEWDSSRIFYWQSKEHYLEIEIFSNKVNIWRSGTSSWRQRNDTLIIKKWNGEEYADVTTEYKQETSKIINGEWEKTIYELPKGKYKFFCRYEGNYRIDSEWYIEESPYKIFIEQNNQFYTFNKDGIMLSPSQELTEENFKTNGFSNPSDITEEQWNEAFSDKTDLKLLMWTNDLEKIEIKAKCEVEPFTPYDKLENEFEIYMNS